MMCAMTKCNPSKIQFLPCKGKKIEAEFSDKEITSDAGVLLLREINTATNLTQMASQLIPDTRDQLRITHSIDDMLKQRIFGLALGYEDLNDHAQLRHDPAIKLSAEKEADLASPSTLCRLENSIEHATNVKLQKLIVDQFIKSFKQPPKQLIFDADPTDDEVHGNQENKAYHSYYGHHCFLPLHIFCGKQLLISYLRPSNLDPAKHITGIMKLLVNYIRQYWPRVKIIFRADGGLCRDKMLRWFERNNVFYVVGYTRNSRLEKMTKGLMARAAFNYERYGVKQKLFDQFFYSAKAWKGGKRKVIVKAEYSEKGKNLRFILTNMRGLPEKLYKFYCLRGEMENRIKEIKLDCYSGRTSCHDWEANQFRLTISSFAYILLESIRRIALHKTKLKNATCNTIRVALLKVGAVITRTKRKIHIAMSECFVNKFIFTAASHEILSTG